MPMNMHGVHMHEGCMHPYELVTQGHLLYLEHLEYLLLVLLARDARHDALARPPAAVAVV